MEYGYITFRSVTHAQRGERILEGAGVRCVLQRTPRWMEEQGCGYCLRLRPGELRAAAEALRRGGAVYRRIWVPGDGGMKEAAL